MARVSVHLHSYTFFSTLENPTEKFVMNSVCINMRANDREMLEDKDREEENARNGKKAKDKRTYVKYGALGLSKSMV